MSSNVSDIPEPSAAPSSDTPTEQSSDSPATSNTPSAAPSSSDPPAPESSAAPTSQSPSAESSAPAPSPSPSPAPSSDSPPASSAAQSSAAPAPTSKEPAPVSTSVVIGSSADPTTSFFATSVITITQSASQAGGTPQIIVITSTNPANTVAQSTATDASTGTGAADPENTDPTELQGAQEKDSGGLSTGGKTAIAVVIPVVVVALLVLGGIFFWRKRKQSKNAKDERRKEVEEYGFNPNHDPTLPAVGGLAMAEDDSGYRGWGNTATSSNRKMSTTLTSGMTYSDSNSNPGGYASPNSPTNAYSDAHSNDPLVDGRRETMDSDGIGALGVVNGAAAPNSANNQAGVHRGSSNASSSYSAANHSDNSGDYPGMASSHPQELYNNQDYYHQNGPYGNNDAYGGQQQPIIRDVSARRNTRIENPSIFPQQGNSGIAQNF